MTSIQTSRLPSRISFQQIWAGAECLGSAVPGKAVAGKPESSSSGEDRLFVLGRFFHDLLRRVLERSPEGPDLADCVRQIFSSVSADYAERYPKISFKYDPLVLSIYESVRHHSAVLIDIPGVKYLEQSLSSRDGSLWGIPDYVAVHSSGIALLDFKLTTSLERLKTERNISQLALYSYLVQEEFGVSPSEVRLIGLKGQSIPVDFPGGKVDEVVRLGRRLEQTFEEVRKKLLDLESIATPSLPACNKCRHRDICAISVSRS